MKTSKLYLYLSIASIVLTFFTGIGFILSIVMLFLISSEKKSLLIKYDPFYLQQELGDLKTAKKISIINLILNLLLIILVILVVLFIGFAYIFGSPNYGR